MNGAGMGFQESRFRASQRTASTAVAGLIGGVIAFALSEPYGRFIDRFDGDLSTAGGILAQVGVWFALAILGIGGALTAADSAINKDWEKARFLVLRAAPLLLVGGVIAGFVAQLVYQNIVDFEAVARAYERCREAGDPRCFAGLRGQLPGRAIGWAVAGMLGGIPIGLAASSRTLAQNGAVGGLIGGLIGGAAFDSVGTFVVGGPEGLPRLVGFLLIGTLIGVAFSAITAARTSVFLEVMNGDHAGTQFPLTDATMLVGCASNAAITLRGDRNVKEHHFELRLDGDRLTYECVRSSPAIAVDGVSATSGAIPLGSTILVGSTELRIQGSRRLAGGAPGGSIKAGGAAGGAAGAGGPGPSAPPARPSISTRDVQPAPRPSPPPGSGEAPRGDAPRSRPSIPTNRPDQPHP